MATITKTIDLNEPIKVSDEAIVRFDAIKEDDIDYSDIPELDEEFFKQAVKIHKIDIENRKKQISLRIDKDILDWLKSSGKGYQTRANLILRAAMEAGKNNMKTEF